MDALAIQQIRQFNRTVTEGIGALHDRFLGRARPLGEARLLWEIGPEGAEVRALRSRLGLDSGYVSRLLRSLQRQRLARVRVDPARGEHKRHIRKYADGELGPDASFYFRGADGRLNLRAQNLRLFLQTADGVDDETWLHHLRQRDYSRWIRQAVKDEDLADEVATVENAAAAAPALSAGESRARVRAAVEARYTAPA